MFSVKPDQICADTCSVQQKSELVPELAIETFVSKLLFFFISSLAAHFSLPAKAWRRKSHILLHSHFTAPDSDGTCLARHP